MTEDEAYAAARKEAMEQLRLAGCKCSNPSFKITSEPWRTWRNSGKMVSILSCMGCGYGVGNIPQDVEAVLRTKMQPMECWI